MRRFSQIVTDFGWPRIIIFIFLVFMFLSPPLAKLSGVPGLAGVANISLAASFSAPRLFLPLPLPITRSPIATSTVNSFS